MRTMRAISNEEWIAWEQEFAHFLKQDSDSDAAHDSAHVGRVVANAKWLAAEENARLEIVIPAAWLHDCVAIPKDSVDRSHASLLAAEKAEQYLQEHAYPNDYIPAIVHAITAHSFSAQIMPKTLEAQVLQDADRLDAIGAIGIARCFVVGGALNTLLYDPEDPFADSRPADDSSYVVDHFFVKLLGLVDTMKTDTGRKEALVRTDFMRRYLAQLRGEIQI